MKNKFLLFSLLFCIFIICSCSKSREKSIFDLGHSVNINNLDDIKYKINSYDHKKTAYIYNGFSICVVDNESNEVLIHKSLHIIAEFELGRMGKNNIGENKIKGHLKYDELVLDYDKLLYVDLKSFSSEEYPPSYHKNNYNIKIINCSWIENENKILLTVKYKKLNYFIIDVEKLTIEEVDKSMGNI